MSRTRTAWPIAVWRLHTGSPIAVLLSLVSAAVVIQSGVSTYRNLVSPAWSDIWNWAPAYQNWLDGTYGWREFLAPYYEHRIVLTKLLMLADCLYDGMYGRIETSFWIRVACRTGLARLEDDASPRGVGRAGPDPAAILGRPAGFGRAIRKPRFAVPGSVSHRLLCLRCRLPFAGVGNADPRCAGSNPRRRGCVDRNSGGVFPWQRSPARAQPCRAARVAARAADRLVGVRPARAGGAGAFFPGP